MFLIYSTARAKQAVASIIAHAASVGPIAPAFSAAVFGALAWASPALARNVAVVQLQDRAFPALSERTPETMYHRYELKPFRPEFVDSIFNLYPGSEEPWSDPEAPKVLPNKQVALAMYLSSVTVVLNARPTQIDLTQLASIERIRRADPTIKQELLSREQAEAHQNWGSIFPETDRDLWCRPPSVCMESRFPLSGVLGTALRVYYRTSQAIALSEMRASASLGDTDAALRSLSGIDAPTTSAFQQTFFSFGKVRFIRFAKIIAIVQPHPADASKSVLSAFVAIALKQPSLDKAIPRTSIRAEDVAMGRTAARHVLADRGITSGLPNFASETAQALINSLD